MEDFERPESVERTKNALLRWFLKCGSLDVDFICRKLDDFDVDIEDVIEEIEQSFDLSEVGANLFIEEIFRLAVYKAMEEAGLDSRDFPNGMDSIMSTYTNCMDSHLYIQNSEGDSIQVLDYQELLEELTKLSPNYEPENEEELCLAMN